MTDKTTLPEPFDRKRFERAPCYVCGYNGPGYYQPDSHPCAKLYHDKTPALPEPVAYQYRWKIDGEWTNWRVSDASQKHSELVSLEERQLVPATQLQEALDRADRAESEITKIAIHLDAEFDSDSILHVIREAQADRDIFKDRATIAESSLAETCGSKATCDQVISEWSGRLEAAEAALATAEAERDAAHNEALDRAAARLRLVFAISGEPYALQVLYLKKETPNANR